MPCARGARGASDRLDQRRLPAQEALLVGIEDGHQRDLGQVEPLAQQVHAHQHVEHALAKVAQQLADPDMRREELRELMKSVAYPEGWFYVERASVIVKFVEGRSVVKLGKKIMTTYQMRTNQDGIATIPPIPQGKIQVQVIAKGFQTFGQIYDVAEEEKTIEIKLNDPQSQYSVHEEPKKN